MQSLYDYHNHLLSFTSVASDITSAMDIGHGFYVCTILGVKYVHLFKSHGEVVEWNDTNLGIWKTYKDVDTWVKEKRNAQYL